ncbi:MAG: multiprotein bridging factor aMBF1 [Nanoarchaeota archaeon]
MQCDLCGNEEQLYLTDIEGSQLNVCNRCGQHGKIIKKAKGISSIARQVKERPRTERVLSIISGYGSAIRKKRDMLGMSQKDFARTLNEKESLIHKMETGSFEPSLEMARKLEKLLGMTLVEEIESNPESMERKTGNGLTIGDLIRIRKR